jgi:CRISPR-associated protein Cas6
MAIIEMRYPVLGTTLPTDHGYPLFSAISRLIPWVHQPTSKVRFAPIPGVREAPALIRLSRESRLRIRLPAEEIPRLLPLAGKSLAVGKHRMRLGVPEVASILPAPELRARIVVFRLENIEPDYFLETVRARLAASAIGGDPEVSRILSGPREGEPRRRVLRIKGRRLIGFALEVVGLNSEDSVRLQENGLGSRGHLGCGYFLPVLAKERAQ